MQDMTPEERLTRIENLLATVVESQARHDSQIEKQNAVLDKHTAAIQDLIVISRTLLDSHQQTGEQIDKLRHAIAEMGDKMREAQQATDEKLHILIETVDRIIRQMNK
jgi:chromosome segregation ATPase